jgi:hypothetical protein
LTDLKTTPATAGVSNRQRNCAHCDRELVNAHGVHMGIPFGHKSYQQGMDKEWVKLLVCASCYDDFTTIDNIQRTGDQTI